MTGNTGEVLVAGYTYIMHEESAPEGYAQAADVEFYFNGDGTIPNCGYHLVKMVDQPSATPTPSNPSENRTKRPTRVTPATTRIRRVTQYPMAMVIPPRLAPRPRRMFRLLQTVSTGCPPVTAR